MKSPGPFGGFAVSFLLASSVTFAAPPLSTETASAATSTRTAQTAIVAAPPPHAEAVPTSTAAPSVRERPRSPTMGWLALTETETPTTSMHFDEFDVDFEALTESSTRTEAIAVAPVAPWPQPDPRARRAPVPIGPGLMGQEVLWPEVVPTPLAPQPLGPIDERSLGNLAPELLGPNLPFASRPKNKPSVVKKPRRPGSRILPPPNKAPLSNKDRSCRGLWHLPRTDQPNFDVGEELGYELSIAGAYVGRFETKVGRPREVDGKRVLPLFGRARTSGFASALKPFEGRYMAMATPQRLAPIGLRVESTYADDERWERVRFNPKGTAVRADFTLRGQRLRRDYTSNHTITDLLSMLFLARQINIHPGLAACQHVFGARRLWRMTATVNGTEKMSTPIGRMEAWRVKVTFDRMHTPGLNNTKRPQYDMNVFLAQNRSHTPLAFVVEYKGMKARGDLQRWSLRGKTKEKTWAF